MTCTDCPGCLDCCGPVTIELSRSDAEWVALVWENEPGVPRKLSKLCKQALNWEQSKFVDDLIEDLERDAEYRAQYDATSNYINKIDLYTGFNEPSRWERWKYKRSIKKMLRKAR